MSPWASLRTNVPSARPDNIGLSTYDDPDGAWGPAEFGQRDANNQIIEAPWAALCVGAEEEEPCRRRGRR
jgi:hypothetical protein